ncbi:MAG: twin-arginine translocase subunit TatC [Actinobacteria bacterium]|nr:MAG: twin-arginine translocase subunit TatC [Actinomycetota bacterium]
MASAALRRPVRHEDRLSLVEHLDELRSRLIVAFVALVAAFSVCFAFNGTLLDVVNRPLEHETQKNVDKGRGPLGQIKKVEDGVRGFSERLDTTLALLARPDSGLPRATRALLVRQRAALQAQRAQLPKITGNRPVTLGIGEPFTNTLIVSLYFAILLAMPFLLWQAYAFVLPAFSPEERRIALPLLMMIPGLFLIGVAFGYFLVLPAAVRFLQNFNADNFNILIQGRDYYRFAALTLVAMGIVFQVPVGILALTRTGVLSVQQLRRNRRYAFVICFVVATPLPGTDPVSMIIESLMLYLLYEVGILLSAVLVRPREPAAASEDLTVSS